MKSLPPLKAKERRRRGWDRTATSLCLLLLEREGDASTLLQRQARKGIGGRKCFLPPFGPWSAEGIVSSTLTVVFTRGAPPPAAGAGRGQHAQGGMSGARESGERAVESLERSSDGGRDKNHNRHIFQTHIMCITRQRMKTNPEKIMK